MYAHLLPRESPPWFLRLRTLCSGPALGAAVCAAYVCVCVCAYACAGRQTSVSSTLPMIHLRLLFVWLCQACTAFVSVPATTRLPLWRAQPVLRPCAPRAAAVSKARPPPPSPHGLNTRPIRRRSSLWSSSTGGVGEGNVAAGAAPEDDPFRPERASVSPMVINAIVPVLFKHVRRRAPHQPIPVR